MARSVGTSIENNFVNGLITEATGLNFPESACTETWNCVFDQRGRVTRRKGIDYEDSFVPHVIDRTNKAQSMFLWESAGGDGNTTLVVHQVGVYLHVYRVSPTGALSNGYIGYVQMVNFQGGYNNEQIEFQYASGNGQLIVTHPNMVPTRLVYDTNLGYIPTATPIFIQIRDFEGRPFDYAVDLRPTSGSYTVNHEYNLRNHGWSGWQNAFFSVMGYYPSMADVWWMFKDESGAFHPETTLNLQTRGNSPAPTGFFIFDAFNIDRSAAIGRSGLPVQSAGYSRPSTCAFFAGRVFYAGVNAQGFSSNIYFSQIIENDQQWGMCYQQNDPTSEDTFSLLATDGGVVKIPEAGQIFKLQSIEGALIVFASNGIWSLTGSTGMGFSATDYTVKKISTIYPVSASSFVDVAGYPIWWSSDGIYTMTVNTSLGQTQIQSLVDKKIRDFYLSIPESSKATARGSYNPIDRTVQWIYKSNAETGIVDRYDYNAALIFNPLTQAFYPWNFDTSQVKIHGITVVKGTGTVVEDEIVTNTSGIVVTDTNLADVTTGVLQSRVFGSLYKYVVSYNGNITFAETSNATYEDWTTAIGGVDYSSWFITGYKVRGEGQMKFQSNYVTIFQENQALGSFYIQGVWNYSNSPNNGMFGSKQRIDSSDTTYDVTKRRIKIRGNGLALQMKVTSVSGKPFALIGWSVFESANSAP